MTAPWSFFLLLHGSNSPICGAFAIRCALGKVSTVNFKEHKLSFLKVERYRPSDFLAFSVKTFTIAVSKSSVCNCMIHNIYVTHEVLLASYFWCHDEYLVPNCKSVDFPGHAVLGMPLLFA